MVGVSLKDHIWGFVAGLGRTTGCRPGVVRLVADGMSTRHRSQGGWWVAGRLETNSLTDGLNLY